MNQNSKTPIADQIAALEQTIDRLQQRWKPYARVQPVLITSFQNPLQYDPSRLIEKQELALQIDEAQAELASLKAQLAREPIADVERDVAEAEQEATAAANALAEIERAYREAVSRDQNARGDLSLARERLETRQTIIATHDRERQKWADERRQDQATLASAQDIQQRQQQFRILRDRDEAA